MIEALTPNGTNHPLHVRSLPRGARRGQHFMDAHVSHLFSKVLAKDSIAVAEQVAGDLVKGECFPQLLPCPLCGRVGRHIEVKDATPVMGQGKGDEPPRQAKVAGVCPAVDQILLVPPM